MILNYIIYFTVGVTFNLIQTTITRAVVADRRVRASLLSGTITMIRLTTMAFVMKEAFNHNFLGVAALAAGTALGTFLAFYIKK